MRYERRKNDEGKGNERRKLRKDKMKNEMNNEARKCEGNGGRKEITVALQLSVLIGPRTPTDTRHLWIRGNCIHQFLCGRSAV